MDTSGMIHDLSTARTSKSLLHAGLDGAAAVLDTIETVTDYSRGTLETLSGRIAQSSGYEQLVYREVELDEVWRLLEASIAEARRIGGTAAEIVQLETLRDATMEAHDMVSDRTLTQAAADRLRSALG
jgi:hypothetical protein